MARYFVALLSYFLATALVIAGVWFIVPRVVGERAPGGLLGMIFGICIVASMKAARRKLPNAVEGKPRA